jgi:hypothetical protein
MPNCTCECGPWIGNPITGEPHHDGCPFKAFLLRSIAIDAAKPSTHADAYEPN